MSFLKQLAKAELVAIAALVIAGAALAGLSAWQASLSTDSLLGVGGSARMVFLYTLIIGCLPVALFGAPLYSVLRHLHKVSWPRAVAIGIVPGAVLSLIDLELGFLGVLCGAFISSATHAICGAGPNQSFKPTPSARLNSRC
jgi:hypothetical protein